MAWCRMSNQSVSIRSHGWAVSQKLPRHYNGHHSCKQLVSMRQLRVAAKGGHSLQSVILSKRRSKSWDIRPSLPSCPTSVLSLFCRKAKNQNFYLFQGQRNRGHPEVTSVSSLSLTVMTADVRAALSALSLSLFLSHSLSNLTFFSLFSSLIHSPISCNLVTV